MHYFSNNPAGKDSENPTNSTINRIKQEAKEDIELAWQISTSESLEIKPNGNITFLEFDTMFKLKPSNKERLS